MTEYVCYIINVVLILSIFTYSLNLLLGYAGQFSMATAAFGGVGGYLSAWMAINLGISYLPGLLIAAVAGLVLGIVICLFAIRLSLEYLVVLTVAFSSASLSLIVLIPGLGGINSLQGVPAMSVFGFEATHQWQQTPLILIPTAIIVFMCWRLGESPYGRLLKSVRDDEDATLAVGKSPLKAKLYMFSITSAMAAVSGCILGFSTQLQSITYYGSPKQIQIIAEILSNVVVRKAHPPITSMLLPVILRL
ncbi:MAG: branched-chain amino acid ABC transporter permease [Syntrophales bacterium]|jgi:branched-chain amino acid transport system permease protein|nr:branched-chain amino acid ABC transporter permease [Syntrophales bacterium]